VLTQAQGQLYLSLLPLPQKQKHSADSQQSMWSCWCQYANSW